MDVETRLDLVTRGLQEIIVVDELRELLETKDHPRGYVGFEPSGLMHAGTGLIVGKKMRDYADAGFHFIIYLAEWHGWINNKMGGKLENLAVASEYFKDCFTALGLPEGKVEYLWASDIVDTKDYWEKVVRVMKANSLRRTLRAMPIMGRSADSVDVETAWALYPAMQASDIFQMELDCACSGMDQRKVHMLAREVAPRLGFKPPVCLHNPLLPGLQQTAAEGSFDDDEAIDKSIRHKMSKSVGKGALWINDSPEEVREQVRRGRDLPQLRGAGAGLRERGAAPPGSEERGLRGCREAPRAGGGVLREEAREPREDEAADDHEIGGAQPASRPIFSVIQASLQE
jgi:tyrosyl-tRNA synthetase